MNCFYHPTQAAVAICIVCKKGLCSSCIYIEKEVKRRPMSYCASCAVALSSKKEQAPAEVSTICPWNFHMDILPPSYDVRGSCTIRSMVEGMSS